VPSSSTLRQIWLIIEQTHKLIFLELSDSELVYRIQAQLEERLLLTIPELNAAHLYIRAKVPLIRDLADNL
jgi:hypothetical protein